LLKDGKEKAETTRVRECWAHCSLCVLDVDIPYTMELA